MDAYLMRRSQNSSVHSTSYRLQKLDAFRKRLDMPRSFRHRYIFSMTELTSVAIAASQNQIRSYGRDEIIDR